MQTETTQTTQTTETTHISITVLDVGFDIRTRRMTARIPGTGHLTVQCHPHGRTDKVCVVEGPAGEVWADLRRRGYDVAAPIDHLSETDETQKQTTITEFFQIKGRGVAKYARGWYYSTSASEPPDTWQDSGNGPEVVGEYFGPFASERAAERHAEEAIADLAAERDCEDEAA